jgi:hypothetical protein
VQRLHTCKFFYLANNSDLPNRAKDLPPKSHLPFKASNISKRSSDVYHNEWPTGDKKRVHVKRLPFHEQSYINLVSPAQNAKY